MRSLHIERPRLRVDLRCRHTRMTQQLLDVTNVRSSGQHVRCRSVPISVSADCVDACASRRTLEHRTETSCVKRNVERFPGDFMFQLSKEEFETLRSQSVISKKDGRGGRRSAPYAFTEQGVAMLSTVLKSKKAVAVNIEIMRTFVKLRVMLGSHDELRNKVLELESKYDKQFQVVFDTIRQLIQPPPGPAKRIGF